MNSNWKMGVLGDLIEEADSEVAPEPWEHELITVRLHAAGLIPAGKKPNRTKSGRKHYFRRQGEILVGRQNFHRRCVGVVTEDLDGMVTSNAISAFVARQGVSARFAQIVMSLKSTAETADRMMPGSGQREISVKNLLSIPAPFPSFEEQRRIVDLIGSVDDAIDAVEGDARSLQEFHATVLAKDFKAITGDEVPLDSLFGHIIGGSWGNPPGEDEVDVVALGPTAYAGGRTEVDPSLGSTRSLSQKRVNARALQVGDIVLERSGGSPTQPVGRVLRMSTAVPNVVPSDFMRLLRPDTAKIEPGFAYWALWVKYRAGESLPFQKFTTGIRNLNIPDYLSQSTVRIPLERSEQVRIAELGDSLRAAFEALTGQATSLRTLRSDLLTALLSGAHLIPESYDERMTAY